MHNASACYTMKEEIPSAA